MADPTTPSSATAGRILETALDVFSEAGFQGTSIREISRRGSVNVAAVNYHWGSKQKLWFAVCGLCRDRLMNTVGEALEFPLDPQRVLETVVSALFDGLAADPRPIRILMWSWLQQDAQDSQSTGDAFQPLVDMCLEYTRLVRGSGGLPGIDVEVVLGLVQACVMFPFMDPAGTRRFFGTDLSDPAHVHRVKEQVLRSSFLLLGGSRPS